MTRALLLAALLFAASPANAATRNYGVSGFDRIRLDGDYQVTVTNGVAPFAKATGTDRAIDSVSIRVEGRTLVIRTYRSTDWGGFPGEGSGPVEIAVGMHELSEVWVNGAGSLAIDKVSGLKFGVVAQGAGLVSIGRMDVDQLDLALSGAASARLAGRAASVKAILRGSSTLDSPDLASKDAVIGAEGPANARLTATETAKVDAVGVSKVVLLGNPTCTLNVRGSAGVSGCKPPRR